MQPSTQKYSIKKRFSSGPFIKDINEIFDAKEEELVVPVEGAKVVVADYRLLIHDFKDVFQHESFKKRYQSDCCETSCSKSCAVCHRAIDRWLIDNAAFVSAQQTQPNQVNSTIECGEPVRRGFRPPRYGRALVMPIDQHVSDNHPRFLDVKGTGVGDGITPTNDRHANGLDYLGVALADFFFAWLVDKVFECAVPSYSVTPVYAVIDLGFDLKDYVYGTAPAGLHVRRAHHRFRGMPLNRWQSDAEKISMHMELILRSFGLTSTAPSLSMRVCAEDGVEYIQRSSGFKFDIIPPEDKERCDALIKMMRGRRMDITNIQFANAVNWAEKKAEIVDFGLFQACAKFDMPFATTTIDRPFLVGRTMLPEEPAYVSSPVKGIAVDTDLASRASVNGVSFHMAQAFRHGLYDRKDIETIYRKGMARVWPTRASA